VPRGGNYGSSRRERSLSELESRERKNGLERKNLGERLCDRLIESERKIGVNKNK
jgi:hypothetical protein